MTTSPRASSPPLPMTNRDRALEFLGRFCDADVDGIEPLLSDDVKVSGPLFSGTSRNQYLRALRSDPPERCGFSLVGLTEEGHSVSVFYDLQKHDLTMRVAQLFRFTGERISEIVLVFDPEGSS